MEKLTPNHRRQFLSCLPLRPLRPLREAISFPLRPLRDVSERSRAKPVAIQKSKARTPLILLARVMVLFGWA